MTTTWTNTNKSYTNYNNATAYTVGQVVMYLNVLYVNILSSTGNLPTNITYWKTMWNNQVKS